MEKTVLQKLNMFSLEFCIYINYLSSAKVEKQNIQGLKRIYSWNISQEITKRCAPDKQGNKPWNKRASVKRRSNSSEKQKSEDDNYAISRRATSSNWSSRIEGFRGRKKKNW